jgi:hypothetical protein
MKNKDQIILENLYDSISNDKFSYPLIVFHGTDLESANDIKQKGLDLSKCDRGYFGKAFYVTTDEQLARSNYADFSGDEEGGIVLGFEMNPINKVFDLRNSKDSEEYSKITNLKYTLRNQTKEIYRFMGYDEFPDIMNRYGIDAIYDRSFEGFAIYNLDILKVF